MLPIPEGERNALNSKAKIVNSGNLAELSNQITACLVEGRQNIFRPADTSLNTAQVDFLYELQAEYNFTAQDAAAIVLAHTGTPEKLELFMNGEEDWHSRINHIGTLDIVDPDTASIKAFRQYAFAFRDGTQDSMDYQTYAAQASAFPEVFTESDKLGYQNEHNLLALARLVDQIKSDTRLEIYLIPIGRQNTQEAYSVENDLELHKSAIEAMNNGSLKDALDNFTRLLAGEAYMHLIYQMNLESAFSDETYADMNSIIQIDNGDIEDHPLYLDEAHRDPFVEYPEPIGLKNILYGAVNNEGISLIQSLSGLGVKSAQKAALPTLKFLGLPRLQFELMRYYIYNILKTANKEQYASFFGSRYNQKCWEHMLGIFDTVLKSRSYNESKKDLYEEFLSKNRPGVKLLEKFGQVHPLGSFWASLF